MNDFRGNLGRKIEEAMSKEDPAERMKVLYWIADQLNEDVPYELAKQIEVYAMILQCIGRLGAAASFDAGLAEANRKRVYGHTLATAEGTQAVKEGLAEMAAYEYRVQEAKANAEFNRWRSAFSATQELIHAKKQTLAVLNAELGRGNGTGR